MKLVKLPVRESLRDAEGYKTTNVTVEINPEHISSIQERTEKETTTKEVKICRVQVMNDAYHVQLSREELDKALKGA